MLLLLFEIPLAEFLRSCYIFEMVSGQRWKSSVPLHRYPRRHQLYTTPLSLLFAMLEDHLQPWVRKFWSRGSLSLLIRCRRRKSISCVIVSGLSCLLERSLTARPDMVNLKLRHVVSRHAENSVRGELAELAELSLSYKFDRAEMPTLAPYDSEVHIRPLLLLISFYFIRL